MIQVKDGNQTNFSYHKKVNAKNIINRSHEELIDSSVLTNSIHPDNKYSIKDLIDRLVERELDAVNKGLASSGRLPLTKLFKSHVQVKW